MAMTRSAGFDGRRFYYAAGGERVVLLDTEDAARPVAPSLRGCLLRQLRAAGTDAEAMGASLALILLTAALVRRPAAEPRLLLSVGGGSLSCQAAALLRAYFWAERPSAAAPQERSAALASCVCVLGREGERQPAFPELLPPAPGALPAPAAGSCRSTQLPGATRSSRWGPCHRCTAGHSPAGIGPEQCGSPHRAPPVLFLPGSVPVPLS